MSYLIKLLLAVGLSVSVTLLINAWSPLLSLILAAPVGLVIGFSMGLWGTRRQEKRG